MPFKRSVMSKITEIVTMQIADGIARDEFIAIVDGLEVNYHSKQPGFIDCELIYYEPKDTWLMIMHWESKEQLQVSSQKMFKDSAAEPFVKSLNPKSVKMTITPQIKAWSI